jgi:DMSO/TMAO reductase YedYZ molybdopterin-dependent catalytic subunit
MADRRLFLKQLAGYAAGFLSASVYWVSKPEMSWGAVRRLLPKSTKLETLVNENPAHLDARHLELEPLEQFETMGLSDQAVDLKTWRLVCTGRVKEELRLTYDQVRALPPLEKPVLLVCPGFFATYGRWKGISLAALAIKAGVKKGVTHVTITGPEGPYEKTARFPWKEVEAGRVFLAYQVNGVTLPVKHGYPLRLVAEGVYGSEWVKYVYQVQFDKIDSA